MTCPLPSPPSPHRFTSLLAKYDTALSLYDDLAHDISQMKKATQHIREKTLKLFATKARRKKAFGIQSDALDVLLAAGVKAQQRRKGTGPRKARRRDSCAGAPTRSPATRAKPKTAVKVKRRESAGSNDSAAPAVNLKVRFELTPTVPVRSVHAMSTRRSSKKML